MCGIFGIAPSVEHDTFVRALQTMAHRGPDDFGIFESERISLGHQRLAIQDLSPNGHQPMSDLDRQVWIVFNGEIYNHLDIRKTLPQEIQFKGTSDTETILYGYLHFGIDVVKKLNGIFAMAIYDTRSADLFLIRDPLGVKPLYYYCNNEVLGFASEIKALHATVDEGLEINVQSFQDYIHFLWAPGSETPFKNILKLEPGHYLQKNLNDKHFSRLVKYYEIPFCGSQSDKSEKQLTDDLEKALQQAVDRQLLSDVPVGFFLSGGWIPV